MLHRTNPHMSHPGIETAGFGVLTHDNIDAINFVFVSELVDMFPPGSLRWHMLKKSAEGKMAQSRLKVPDYSRSERTNGHESGNKIHRATEAQSWKLMGEC
ncbi:hypothetical protein AAC387_Pa09g1197 [Persea americana]